MNNIIKRRKTSKYAQIHNAPLQGGLEDLRAVGLLAHIMSLPEDWTIYKTQLHATYSRRNVDAAWKELTEKNYVIGFYCHVSGKKNYFYSVSDIPFTQDEFEDFALEHINELQKQNKTVMNFNLIPHSTFEITEKISVAQNVQQKDLTEISVVRNVQFKTNSSKRAYTKEVKNKEKETKKRITTTTVQFENANLQEAYPDIHIEQLSKEVLTDDRFTIDSRLQYRAVMEFKIEDLLKAKQNVKKPRKSKAVRTEPVPDWLHKENVVESEEPKMTIDELAERKARLEQKMEKLKQR